MNLLIPAIIVAAAILAMTVVLLLILRNVSRGRDSNTGLTLLQNQVQSNMQQTAQMLEALRSSLKEAMDGLTGQVTRSVGESNRMVGERLDNASRVIGDVRQKLGQIDESSRRLMDIGKDIASLQDILKPPKLRGALGELLLGDLLAQILPPAHFELQHSFRGGQVVDAVLRLHAGLVPVDAKFPLENFRRILASDGETQAAARRAFLKDVRGHVDAISGKYIRVDEGTFDFALMYIPAENVYYESIIQDHEQAGDLPLLSYALKKKVIPVSPNTFYAYLQTVLLGLKGMRVEERSREILGGLARLEKEMSMFDEAFRLLGQHLDNSQRKYQDAQKRFEKIEGRLGQMNGLAREEEPSRAAENILVAD
jgi:DNA recombination protein RmuC